MTVSAGGCRCGGSCGLICGSVSCGVAVAGTVDVRVTAGRTNRSSALVPSREKSKSSRELSPAVVALLTLTVSSSILLPMVPVLLSARLSIF